MFNFFKQTFQVFAPVSGKTVNLAAVPDPIFYDQTMGKGIAIISTGDTFVAPCHGTLTLLFDAYHAFSITTKEGIEVLVHIGLETVALAGKGSTALHQVGETVKLGTPIIKIDRKFMEANGYNLITPTLIINHHNLSKFIVFPERQVTAGQDKIIEYQLRKKTAYADND